MPRIDTVFPGIMLGGRKTFQPGKRALERYGIQPTSPVLSTSGREKPAKSARLTRDRNIPRVYGESMSYYTTTELACDYDQAIERTRSVLKDKGFGVLSEIDVHEKFKEKLDRDFRRYKILGACNPAYAYKALQAEDKIGTMLPCNVIVQEHAPDRIEVSAIDPIASMQAVKNPDLQEVAAEVQRMLAEVIKELGE